MIQEKTERTKAYEILERLTGDDNSYTHKEILEFIICNFLSGKQALEVMEASKKEFPPFEDSKTY